MIYVIFDFETTGPSPIYNAALSLGAAAVFDAHTPGQSGEGSMPWTHTSLSSFGTLFSVNIKVPPDKNWDARTQLWWEAQEPRAREAWAADPVEPRIAVLAFYGWLEGLRRASPLEDDTISFVANPASFDMAFLQSYVLEFAPELFKFTPCLDMCTLAMAAMGVGFPGARREFWPEEWKSVDLQHTHIALEDARAQAHEFMGMMRTLKGLHHRNA